VRTVADLSAFLKELAELTQKHGLEIGGCGDCGSPWIVTADDSGETLLEHLAYCEECSTYFGGSHSRAECSRG